MPSRFFHKVYASRVRAAIDACETVSTLTHQGEKGRIREILLGSLFRPLLPSDLGVGTGFIISAYDQVSRQQDVILYDKSTLPPALFDQTTGFFPIESVIFNIEIKTTLTQDEVSKSHNAAKELAAFVLTAKEGGATMQGPRPGTAILALKSNLSESGSEADRYHKVLGDESPLLSSICVVNRGYWRRVGDGYHAWPEVGDLRETIAFLGGILNTLPAQYEERRSKRPPIGPYLINFGKDVNILVQGLAELEERVSSVLLFDEEAVKELRAEVAQRRRALERIRANPAYSAENPQKWFLLLTGTEAKIASMESRLGMAPA